MALLKNVASQYIPLTVYSTSTGLPITVDDHANLTGEIAKDGGSFAAATGAFTERLSSASAHIGEFLYAPSQEETNGNLIEIRFYSATANYVVAPITILTDANSIGTTQTGDAYLELTSVIVPDLVTITTNQTSITSNQNVILADLVTITSNQSLQSTLVNDNIIKADLVTITTNQASQALDSTVSKPGTAQTITPPATMATLANQNSILADLVTITTNQSTQATLANQNIIIPDLVTLTTNIGTVNSNISAIQTILTGITSLGKWLRGLYRKDTMDATAKSEVNSGGGTFDETLDSTQAIYDEINRIYAQTSVIAPSIVTITTNQSLQALDSTVSKPGIAQTITPPATMATLANQLSILSDLVTITNSVSGLTAPDNTDIQNIWNLLKTSGNGDAAAMFVILNKLVTMLTSSGPNYTFTVDALKNGPTSGGSSIDPQDISDALKLAPTVGNPALGSVYDKLNNVQLDLITITTNLGSPMQASTYVAPDNTNISSIKTVTDKVNTMLAVSGANSTYTSDALKNAPATTINQQDIRDAMKLSPTAGVASTNSIDADLIHIQESISIAQGDGSLAIIIHTQDSNGSPIMGCTVHVFDSTQTTLHAMGFTNVDGNLSIALDAATYKVVIAKQGVYTFTVPETMVITVASTQTFIGTAIPVITPSAGCQLLYLYPVDISSSLDVGAHISIEPTNNNESISPYYLINKKLHMEYVQARTRFEANILQGANVTITGKDDGEQFLYWQGTIDTDSTKNLVDYINEEE